MKNVEAKLKELIIVRYGSLAKFCETIGIPWTTLDSILKRGVEKANIRNILKITSELGIDVEKLAEGEIVYKRPQANSSEEDDLTVEEREEIDNFVRYVKSKRN